MKKIALITVDYNGHKDTRELLDSVKKINKKGFEVKTIVVDNGSDTWEDFTGTEQIQTGKNLGFAGGYNRGMKYAFEWGADYFFIINNDTIVGDKEILQKLVKETERFGMVSPKILFAPGFEFYKEKYEKNDKAIWYAGGEWDGNNVRVVHKGIDEVDAGQYDEIKETEFVSGCCLLITRELVEKVGYFDDQYFAYFEDVDFVFRAKKLGFKLGYCGQTFIYHKVSQTAGIGSAFTDYLLTRNRLYFGINNSHLRTKVALLREAAKMLAFGRIAQKKGVEDWIRGVRGYKTEANLSCHWPVKLSIIILDYKSAKLTEALLKSIGNYPAEVILIDNTVENHECAEVAKKFPKIKFVENKVNTLFTGGNNQGIAYSRGEYVLLLNSDVEVKPEGLEKLVAAADSFAGKAAVAGKLYFPDGTIQDSCYKLPTLWGAFKQYFLNIPGSYFMFMPKGPETVQVEVAVMACLLIPRQVINRVGDLSRKLTFYFEDIEYGRRLKKAGIPIYFVPQAEFIHHHGFSSKKAGSDLSTQRLINGSKIYHGKLKYALLTAILWAGQKVGRVRTPESRWKKE